ncbi:aminotransferase class I/II-fold pyridoxal phosphate-dependent enzyme [Paenibacillus sp. GCM10027627]|uniref:aminotransferase class I/II-fold pyridoxal phosphate-dependent enzyme n=1 Tax=unclassified Paenibacillus TaxID=185978 RepID=UPI00363CB6AB
MLTKHAVNNPLSLHVPGHQYGNALERLSSSDSLQESIWRRFKPLMELDVTELSATDDLHHPEASILQAQRLAAQCFGAEETFFLVGGSTSGNLSLVLTVCKPGDLIIVQRNVHKSILNGLKLAGAMAVFLTPEIEPASGIATVPSVLQLERALNKYPEAKAVFLTNPNYYGMGVKLARYAEAIHRHGIPLLIDEAHGAHYGLHIGLPDSALSSGADAVVQSTHKTLPALTMGAMLHIQGNRLDKDQLKQNLSMIQSSSPSFPIMASLDISRAMIQSAGSELFEPSLEAANSFKRWIKEQCSFIGAMEWKEVEESTEIGKDKGTSLPTGSLRDNDLIIDPLRVLLFDKSGKLSGFDILKQLESYGCWAEMADTRYAVLLIGIGTDSAKLSRLREAISCMDINCKLLNEGLVVDPHSREKTARKDVVDQACYEEDEGIGEPVAFGRTPNSGATQMVPLQKAEGFRAAEMIVPYPPGIPVVYAGERLTGAVIELLKRLAEAGAKFQGAKSERLSEIEVFKSRD